MLLDKISIPTKKLSGRQMDKSLMYQFMFLSTKLMYRQEKGILKMLELDFGKQKDTPKVVLT